MCELADYSGCAVKGVGVQPTGCWDCGFEFRWGPGSRSLVCAILCQVEFPAMGRSLFQRSPNECGVFECNREASIMGRP
jgi:hypothetical protein